MFSIITPTHNTQYLAETYKSLVNQTVKDWEWVVLVNGDAKTDDVKAIVGDDARVQIHMYWGLNRNIGAIKHHAFSLGTGDVLIELDHDDLLSSNALDVLQGVHENYSADFYYSHCRDFFADNSAHYFPQSKENGWEYKNSPIYGEHAVSFAPSAASLSLIYYAPNHLRAWARDFYHKIGGHNCDLPVCDDHELLIRSYLQGSMRLVNSCLYHYRLHENTFKDNLGKIRELTYSLHAKYIEDLVVREAQLRGVEIYDLGGAFDCPKGWISVDQQGAKINADLSKPWPFEDNSVFAFRAHDFIEHLPDKQFTMSELHRCLKPGGWALISVPSTDGRGAFQDPTHVSYWNEHSFWYYTRWEQARYIRNDKIIFHERALYTHTPRPNVPYTVAHLMAMKGNMQGIPGYSAWRGSLT